MQKISYKKYFSNILWFTSTNLLTFVFLIPSVIDLFRDESSVAFGLEEETEDGKFVRWLFRALSFFIHLLRAISGFILNMSASILDYSINFATSFVRKEILNGEAVYQVWSSVRDIGNLLVILFLGIIAVSLISGIFGQITKKSVVWVLGAALLINFSGVITTLVYTSGTVISKGFLTKSEGLIISLKKDKTGTSCKKGVAKCISAAVSITSLDESLYESELFKTLEAAKSDHKKRANEYYEKLAKTKKGRYSKTDIEAFKKVTFEGANRSSLNSILGGRNINSGTAVFPPFNEQAATSEFDSKNQTERKRFIIGLISFVLNIILIVAFLYAALSLFYVGIGVVFLYIISPLGLVAYMITKTGIKSNILEVIKNAWWSNLWGYTFFTPVFLGGLWITISIYSAFRNNLSLVGGAKLIDQGAVGLILMVVMFLKSMEIANNVSGDVGGFIKGVKNKSLNTVKKLGVAGLVGGTALGVLKLTRDRLGHRLNKVSGGRIASQAALRHINRKKDRQKFWKTGFTPKGSIARFKHDIRESENAVRKDPTKPKNFRLAKETTYGAYKALNLEVPERLKESYAGLVKKGDGIEKNTKSKKEGERQITIWEESNIGLKKQLSPKNKKKLKKEQRAAIHSKIVDNDEKIKEQTTKNTMLGKKIKEHTEEAQSGIIFADSNAKKHKLLQDNPHQTLHTFNKPTDKGRRIDRDKDTVEKGIHRDTEDRAREERVREDRKLEIRKITENSTSISTSLLRGVKALYSKGQGRITEVGVGLHRHVNETTEAIGEVTKQLQEKSYNALTDMHKESGRLAKKGVDYTKKSYGGGKKFLKDQLQNRKDKRNKPE